jgi:hypothetical protein
LKRQQLQRDESKLLAATQKRERRDKELHFRHLAKQGLLQLRAFDSSAMPQSEQDHEQAVESSPEQEKRKDNPGNADNEAAVTEAEAAAEVEKEPQTETRGGARRPDNIDGRSHGRRKPRPERIGGVRFEFGDQQHQELQASLVKAGLATGQTTPRRGRSGRTTPERTFAMSEGRQTPPETLNSDDEELAELLGRLEDVMDGRILAKKEKDGDWIPKRSLENDRELWDRHVDAASVSLLITLTQ